MLYFFQARLDSTKRVIRAREERDSMRRVERQFLSMAFLILFVVGLVLALDAVAMNRARDFIHQAIDYFDCLQVRFQENVTLARRRTSALL